VSVFLPDIEILCEECDEYFFKYEFINNIFDLDADPKYADGLFNRIKCPRCDTEFTYETPILVFSNTKRLLICASVNNDGFININSLKRAFEISGSTDWTLRRCSFAMDAGEKIRIFNNGLDDGKVELVKLKCFDDYKNMDLTDNYITFENLRDNELVFTYRDFKDNILETRYISFEEYKTMPQTKVPPQTWYTIDRDWAINYMEETK
jgi:hypothetical protein